MKQGLVGGRLKCQAVVSQPSSLQDVADAYAFHGLKKATEGIYGRKKVGGCEKIHWLRKMRECQWGREGIIWDLQGAEAEGGSSLLGSCCVRKGFGCSRASKKLLLQVGAQERVRGRRRVWAQGEGLGGEGAAGSEEALQRKEDKKCIEYRLLLSFSSL